MNMNTYEQREAIYQERWGRVMKQVDEPLTELGPMMSTEIPDYLLPGAILSWLESIGDSCLKESLIDKEQHRELIDCAQRQAKVFSSVNPKAIRDVLARTSTS